MPSPLNVDNDFRVNRDAMALFNFTGTVWRRALWAMPGTPGVFLWFAYLGKYQNSKRETLGENTLSGAGTIFQDLRDPSDALANGYAALPGGKPVRLLFTKDQQFRGNLRWVFRGVFKFDKSNSHNNLSVWTRISATCQYPSGKWP